MLHRGRKVTGYTNFSSDPSAVVGKKIVLVLAIGISLGFSLSYVLITSSSNNLPAFLATRESLLHAPSDGIASNVVAGHRDDEPAHNDEDRSVADDLFRRVRVLCWVLTQPKNHVTKAKHVKATWGKRCNKLIFMSSAADPDLPAVKLPISEGRNNLWGKTKAAFRYVYEHHRREADWFLKADDDTYVIVENLRYMLSNYSSNSPLYSGCRFNQFSKEGYMSGGAGYVLSRAALDRFVQRALPSPHICKAPDTGAEDAEMGMCLNNVGVKIIDSRDSLERGRFFPFNVQSHLFPSKDKSFWYWKYIYYPTDDGLDCCSDYAITFHYITPQEMYMMDYLIYHLRPYGVTYKYSSPPTSAQMLIDSTEAKNAVVMGANNKETKVENGDTNAIADNP